MSWHVSSDERTFRGRVASAGRCCWVGAGSRAVQSWALMQSKAESLWKVLD